MSAASSLDEHRAVGGDPAAKLRHALDHAAHLLPVQGPIGVFIHHNTLHAYQRLPFEQAVVEAAATHRTEPYMREAAYLDAFRVGRIRQEDVDAVLASEPDAPAGYPGITRRSLRRVLLAPGVRRIEASNVEWLAAEDEIEPLSRLLACERRLEPRRGPAARKPVRPRDGILWRHEVDLDEVVNPVLIRLCGAFFDQGLAYWEMPDRSRGFLACARELMTQPSIQPRHLEKAAAAFHRLPADAMEAVLATLGQLGVERDEWDSLLTAELLSLAGWAGLMRRLEEAPELAPHDRLPCALLEFLAVRLTLTATAVASIGGDAKAWRHDAPVNGDAELESLACAARLFEAARAAGISPDSVLSMKEAAFREFEREVLSFDDVERRRMWHLAYERRHERQILLPLGQHRRQWSSANDPVRLAAQVFFCIDEREEAVRRHLEEVDPEIETYGAAGFFGVAMNYTGMDDAHGAALCPVVVTPRHAVTERPHEDDKHLHEARMARRRLWAGMAWNSFVSTRTLFRGWLSTAVLGVFTLFPMATRVFAPRRYSRIAAWLNDRFMPEPRTELTFMRQGATGHAAPDGLMIGFTVEEKVDRVASVLAPAGLTKGFSRLVVVLGHGSTSLNNPHESAHDCGACGGRRGGPNARIFAMMANFPEVRQGLRARGIFIPDDTWFIGGYHDTCSDEVDLYDLDRMPDSHRADLARVRASLERAREWSAHERARRFKAAPWGIGPAQALHHAEERSEHLAEPRPEYGHCTNAVCIVGRRSITRGLFMDRRAFLVSYDAANDPDGGNLGRVLGAVIPVCGGISLEYYFSFVDNERYGCGTKLPHNITGLVGVMNGPESDLRTGLPWQMVEIHEPVRILFVVEAKPGRLMEVIHKNPELTQFVENRWIRLASMDPETGAIVAYRNGSFEPVDGDDEKLGSAPSSIDWYRGKREHLPMARIERRIA